MARAARLKVYRTPIGFHDAYIAAPSQKAALSAWGTSHDLFATGEAELVTEPALIEAPLAKPGEIVRRVRGTTAEHIAALPPEPEAPRPRKAPPTPPDRAPAPKARPAARPPAKPKPPPRPPKPGRDAIEATKAALAATLEEQRRERQVLAQQERELRRQSRALEASHKAAAAPLRDAVAAAKAAYDTALADWRKAGAASSR